MMKWNKWVKKIAAVLLAVSIMIPVLSYHSVVRAGEDDYPNEILFPVNILDFRADNLLMEFFQGCDRASWNGHRAGLVESELGPDKVPVYKKSAVEELARQVRDRLHWDAYGPVLNAENHYLNVRTYLVDEGDRWYRLGNYDESKAKFDEKDADGKPVYGWTDMRTCMDYAYFVTSNLFKSNETLNKENTTYKNLIFQKVESPPQSGKPAYVFVADQDQSSGGNHADEIFRDHNKLDLIYNSNDQTIRNRPFFELANGYFANGARAVNMWGSNPNVTGIGGDRDGTVFVNYTCDEAGFYDIIVNYSGSGSFKVVVTGNVAEDVKEEMEKNPDQYKNITFIQEKDEDGNLIYVQNEDGEYEIVGEYTSDALTNASRETTVKSIYFPEGENTVMFTGVEHVVEKVRDTTTETPTTPTTPEAPATTEEPPYVPPTFERVTGGCDIVVLDILWDDAIKNGGGAIRAGDSVTFTAVVANRGDRAFPKGTKLGVRFDVEGDGSFTWNDLYYDGLEPGEVVLLTASGGSNGDAWIARDGNINVTAFADDQNLYGEVDENNNRFTKPITVPYGEVVEQPGGSTNKAPDLYQFQIETVDPASGDIVQPGGRFMPCNKEVLGGKTMKDYPDVDVGSMGNEDVIWNGKTFGNYNFTISSHNRFVYKEGRDQTFYFSGDDDVYVYLDNHLIIDLGGAHPQMNGTVNLDELAKAHPEWGWKDGKVVDFDFFYMERRAEASNFYARMNFKLANDMLVFDYPEEKIPYGNTLPLKYNFSSKNELNTNSKFTFTDGFGDIIGAKGLKLADGVELEKVANPSGDYLYKITVKVKKDPIYDETGEEIIDYASIEDKEFYFKRGVGLDFSVDSSGNVVSGSGETDTDIDNAKKLIEYFRDLQLVKDEEIEISGLNFNTAKKPYDKRDSSGKVWYKETDDPNCRTLTIAMKAEYEAQMPGAKPTKGKVSGYSDPIGVLVGSIKVRTDDNSNMLPYLLRYGDFTISRVPLDSDPNNLPVGEVFYRNDNETVKGTDREYTINKLPTGKYTLEFPIENTTLSAYTVTIRYEVGWKDENGNVVVQETDSITLTNDMRKLTLNLEPKKVPVKDKDGKIKEEWQYPEVEFILKAVGFDLRNLT